VRFGAAGARWCGVGGQVDAAVGAEVVAAGESFSVDETVSATRGPTSGSLALISGSRPLRGDANESLPAAASAWDHGCCCRGRWRVAQSLSSRRLSDVEVVHIRGSGTRVPFVMAPRVPVSLHCGCRGLNILGILGVIPCFFLISSTRTHLSAS
jgi:hypothetical protein